MSNYTIILGEDEVYRNPFGLEPEDFRYHVYVIGKTGVGKTTLLKSIVVQKIHAGEGVGLIDPHGDLAEELLDLVPPERIDDVVYFFPGDLEHPASFNLLAPLPSDERPLVAQGIVSAFRSIWRDSWGPRMEYILYNSVAALLDSENVSLLGLPRLLTDDHFRRWVVKQVRDPTVRYFFEEEFSRYDPRFQREAVAPILNKVGQFLGTPAVRNILGQVRNRIDVREMMDQGQIFIANLSKGRIGPESSNLLGSLLTSQFQLSAMARADTDEDDRRDFTLVLDEFQNFGTDVFESLLSEARKYRLSLVLSHQFAAQLPIRTLQAVLGNVGTTVAFRVGSSDAVVLSEEFGREYTPSQLVDLSRFQVVARLQSGGETVGPFLGRTIDPDLPVYGLSNEIIENSRARISMHRNKVESQIKRWFGRRY